MMKECDLDVFRDPRVRPIETYISNNKLHHYYESQMGWRYATSGNFKSDRARVTWKRTKRYGVNGDIVFHPNLH